MQYWQHSSLGKSTVTAVVNMGIIYLVYAISDVGLQIYVMCCQATCPRFELGTIKILNELLYVILFGIQEVQRSTQNSISFHKTFITLSCEINFLNAYCYCTC